MNSDFFLKFFSRKINLAENLQRILEGILLLIFVPDSLIANSAHPFHREALINHARNQIFRMRKTESWRSWPTPCTCRMKYESNCRCARRIIEFLLYKIQLWNFARVDTLCKASCISLISTYIRFHGADREHFDLKSYSSL